MALPLQEWHSGRDNGHSEQKKKKIKNAEARVWGDARGDQKLEAFLRGLMLCCILSSRLTPSKYHSLKVFYHLTGIIIKYKEFFHLNLFE